jgi:hypothetical protein
MTSSSALLRWSSRLVAAGLAVFFAVGAGGPAAAGFYHSRWALLIGVGEFKSPSVPPLRFAGDDVAAVRDLLVQRLGFAADHVVALTGPQATRQGILGQLSRLCDRGMVTADDAVLIYYSGHGQTVPLPRGGDMGFLVPYDAAVDLGDLGNPARYYESCLGMDELRRLSALIPAKHVLFLVDACYSGLAVESRRGVSLPLAVQTVAARPVRQIIVAGLKDEKALESADWGHGAFTFALLQGLGSGAADFDRDGYVTGLELATYLRSAVPRLAPQTPQYASFDGDGEYLFELGAQPPSGPPPEEPPRIQLTAPPDAAGGEGELAVQPVGDTVTIAGLVLGAHTPASLTVDGVGVPLSAATPEDVQAIRRANETQAARFAAPIKVRQGETRVAVVRARDVDGRESTRRLLLRAQAQDSSAPEVRLTDVRVVADDGVEVEWKGLTVASKGLTTASKALTTASKALLERLNEGDRVSLAGFARDDRAVVSVQVMGRAALTRPARSSELDGLGWSAGIAFEGEVSMRGDGPTRVVVTAADAAGNQAQSSVELERLAGPGPQVIILEPPQTREVRGTGLLLPKAVSSLHVAGLARSASFAVSVMVSARPADMRPATADELNAVGWLPPATYFSAEVTVPPTGLTQGISIQATDAAGGCTQITVLARRPGPPVTVTVATDKPGYRIGDRVHVSVSVSRDAYIYLVHDERNKAVTVFLPNAVEPDCLVARGMKRIFPDPAEEARWAGQYALLAQEPAGEDALGCLALPDPLPASLVASLASLDSLADALAGLARMRGESAGAQAASAEDLGRLAQVLGGDWRVLHYQVRR